jgi:hypothetical protein
MTTERYGRDPTDPPTPVETPPRKGGGRGQDAQEHATTWGYQRQPLVFPVILVQKKRSLCFCVDYRKLNNVTRRDSIPLPQTDDILDMLAEATWFSTQNLKSDYWQIDLHQDKEKTVFLMIPGYGIHALWLMETVLKCLTYELCLVSLDIMIGRMFKEHLPNLQIVTVIPRSPPKAQSVEVPTFLKRSKLSRAYCLT